MIWGIGLQFFLGVIVLRSQIGYQVIKFIGDEIAVSIRVHDDLPQD